MNRLTRISATVASSALLVAGFAGVAGASPADITGTGNNSTSNITQTDRTRTRVSNRARVNVANNNPQTATSGEASTDSNRDSADATSGAAGNTSDTLGTVNVDYSAATAAALAAAENSDDGANGDATISDTGNGSAADITQRTSVRTTVRNRSNVQIENNNTQTATSGNANATNNRDSGTVTSGDATNSSVSTFEVNVTY